MKNRMVPEIRFAGFDDEWEWSKLGDIADVTKLAGFEFTKHILYSDDGKIPAIRGLNVKDGSIVLSDVKYIDGSDFSKLQRSKLKDNDIVYTYVGTVGEAAIVPPDVNWYLAPNVSRIRLTDGNVKFILQLLISSNFKKGEVDKHIATSSQPALSMENIRKFKLSIPNNEEQEVIGNFFKQLDNTIALHQQELDNLKQMKQGFLQKMFPKEGETVPEIRFPGFSDEWKLYKLGDLFYKCIEKNTDLEYKDTDMISVAQMQALESIHTSSDEYMKTYNKTDIGDIIFEGHTSKQFRYGRFVLNDFKAGIVSHIYDVYKLKCKMDMSFLKEYINNENIMQSILLRATSNARMMNSLNEREFARQYIRIPLFEEQKKLGDILSGLENAITTNQRELELLKETKKAFLQKMFI